jgi:hypothetical protein
MWSFFGGSKAPARRRETPHEITLRNVRDKYDTLAMQHQDAAERSEGYLRRAKEVMGFPGQPNRGKRKMAAQLVKYSQRLSTYADQISSVQMLLAEQMCLNPTFLKVINDNIDTPFTTFTCGVCV